MTRKVCWGLKGLRAATGKCAPHIPSSSPLGINPSLLQRQGERTLLKVVPNEPLW